MYASCSLSIVANTLRVRHGRNRAPTISLMSSDSAIKSKGLVMVSKSNLKLVLSLLVLRPGLLTLLLLQSQLLVLLLHGLVHGSTLLVHLILKHSTHAGDSLSLLSIGSLLLSLSCSGSDVFSLLLVSPLLLELSVLPHTITVEEVLTLELAASRDMLWDVLSVSVESLL